MIAFDSNAAAVKPGDLYALVGNLGAPLVAAFTQKSLTIVDYDDGQIKLSADSSVCDAIRGMAAVSQ